MMPVVDMWAWVRDQTEPLKRDIKELKEMVEELKHETAERDRAIEKLKHELAELKVQQAQAQAEEQMQAEKRVHNSGFGGEPRKSTTH